VVQWHSLGNRGLFVCSFPLMVWSFIRTLKNSVALSPHIYLSWSLSQDRQVRREEAGVQAFSTALLLSLFHYDTMRDMFFFFLKKFFISLFLCAYIVWAISSPYPSPPPFPLNPPHFEAESVLPLSLILLKREYK
jgi:hypothetical protein